MKLKEIRTVRQFIERASAICRDPHLPMIGSMGYPPILDALTEVAYAQYDPARPKENAMTPQWASSHSEYKDHLRLRSMDLEVQASLKANGIPDLFIRVGREQAAELLDAAAAGL